MAFDLLDIKNNAYEYDIPDGKTKLFLDDNDKLWVMWRHKHISNILQHYYNNTNQYKKHKNEYSESRRDASHTIEMLKMKEMLKKREQDQMEAGHSKLADELSSKRVIYIFNPNSLVILNV